MISYLDAVDEMFAHCKSSWEDVCTAKFGQEYELRYQGVEGDSIPEVAAIWGRASIRTVVQERAGVGQLNNSGATRWRSEGLVSIECFGPKIEAGSFQNIRTLAAGLREKFMGATTTGRVVFMAPKIDDFYYMDLQWYRVMMVSEFQFDEIV